MAGRRTYLYEESHSDGGWIPPLRLPAQAKIRINELIGRSLTDDEISSISKHLTGIRFMRTGFKDASTQDIKRTLSSFVGLDEPMAISAYRKSDSTTQAFIDEAMYFSPEGSSTKLLYPSGKNIKDAAKIARKNIPLNRGGRPKKEYRTILARYALRLWKELGMSPHPPKLWDDSASSIVEFISALSIAVDDEELDLHTAFDLLRKEPAR